MVHVPELRSRCGDCFALCCVLLPFAAESGFGITKPGGVACPHLATDDSCRIHATLRPDGWPGCTVFECFGAGQQVSRVTYGGASWREGANLAEMGAVLSVVRVLHEMLVHLTEAHARGHDAAAGWRDELATAVQGTPGELLGIDLDELHDRVGTILAETAADARATWPDASDLTGADLAGRDLRTTDLRGASLRGSVLIAVDLRGADLTDADLLGADVRDLDVRGAALAGALFLTQPQVNAARGDTATTLPPGLTRPGHWSGLVLLPG